MHDQFQGVDQLTVQADGCFEILDVQPPRFRSARPLHFGWATGNLPEPKNNPQVGMANMRAIMPALQKAKPGPLFQNVHFQCSPPKQDRGKHGW